MQNEERKQFRSSFCDINLWCTILIALKFIKCEAPNNCLSKINCTFANIFAKKR